MPHLDEGTLHALLDGEIPSGELAPMQAHLAGCAECRARLAEERAFLEESDQLIGALEVPPLPRPAVARIAPRRRTWLRPLAFAATVILALGIGYSAGSWRTSTRELATAPAAESVSPAASAARQLGADAPAESSATAGEPAAAPAPRERTATRKDQTPQRTAADALARKEERESAPAPEQRRPSAPVAQSLADAANPVGRVAAVDSASKPAATPPATVAAAPPPAAGARMPEPLRLEERIATGTTAGGLSAKLAAAPRPAGLTLPEAMRVLNGTILLVRGLVPDRLERLGPAIRVVYATSFGELVLTQQLVDGEVKYSLTAPPAFPPDSLEKLKRGIRE